MQLHTLDILSIIVILILALAFLIYTYFKVRKNKCATLCNGCSGAKCGTKNFAASYKVVKFYKA